MTDAFVIVTADFGNKAEIGHHQLKASVTIVRNKRSRCIETTGHGEPKYGGSSRQANYYGSYQSTCDTKVLCNLSGGAYKQQH